MKYVNYGIDRIMAAIGLLLLIRVTGIHPSRHSCPQVPPDVG